MWEIIPNQNSKVRRGFLSSRSQKVDPLTMSGNTLLIIVVLLVVPYVVDVGFYGDFTPTHFSQANLIENDYLDDADFSSDNHKNSNLIGLLRSSPSGISKQDAVSTDTWCPLPGYPITVCLISRPPPPIHFS